jgi:hypothetical protein
MSYGNIGSNLWALWVTWQTEKNRKKKTEGKAKTMMVEGKKDDDCSYLLFTTKRKDIY